MPTLRWTRTVVTVPSGDYRTSEVTQHTTTDGQFSIVPVGGMAYKRSHGVRGDRHTRWIWSGYCLTDHRVGLPAWARPAERHQTVTACKRAAERRLQRYPVETR